MRLTPSTTRAPMTFWQWLNANGRDVEGLTDALAERFADLVGRGHTTAALLTHYTDEFGHLPAERLQALSRAHRVWQIWRQRKRRLELARARAGLSPLSEDLFGGASTPDQLDAISRAARLCDHAGIADESKRLQLLRAGLHLWKDCVGLARKQGRVRCIVKDPAHADAARYDSLIGPGESLAEIVPHRWLAWRRGAREGVLELALEVPTARLMDQAQLYHQALTLDGAIDRTPKSLLDELVLDDLQAWLFSMIDADTEAQAIQTACQSLAGLLRTPAPQVRRLGSIFIGKLNAPIAVVIVDKEGELLAQQLLKADGNWTRKALELFDQHKVSIVALPTSASASELLSALEGDLVAAGVQTQRVRTAALAEARRPLTDPPHRLSVSVASALVLARRVLDPIKAWSAVDTIGIGVAEYQHDLDEVRLRAALDETMELCRLERRKTKPNAVPGGTAMARLNPLVRSVADLRAGMTIHGIVTNISHFGAFISIGLPQEGLVHISELSDQFVSNPNDVVTIGQQVTAHVLSVDTARGRISLSMKSPPSGRTQAGAGEWAGRATNGKPKRSAPPSRAQALANLERLFKK